MKKSMTVINANVRNTVFDSLGLGNDPMFTQIDASTWGTLVKDEEGNMRYVRLKAVVANLKDDISADEMMRAERAEYEATQERKAQKKAEAEAKKAEREAKEKAKKEAAEAAAETDETAEEE